MNRTPVLSFVFDRKKTVTKCKEAPVELRVTFERKQKYLATGIRCLAKHWKSGMVTNRPDAMTMNEQLSVLMADVRQVITDMMKDDFIDINEIPARLELLRSRGMTFVEYAESRSEVRKYGKSDDSGERYERFLRFLREWGGITFFSDVTEKNIMRMDQCLNERGMKPYSKWNNYHRFLNSFIIDAVNEGLLKRNPYKWLHIEKEKSNGGIGKYLERNEFERIRKVELPTKCLERVRDLFVFQTFTCLSYTDLAAFDAKKIIDMNGKKVYVGRRGKTKQEFTFLLLAPALEILDKYDGKLPILSNVKYNEYLKVLAMMAKVNKPLSSHWARHTGATLLLNAGVDMRIVSKVCGHSSMKMTEQVYAKLLDETVVNAMAEMEKRILN